jgi:hypothetical protein
LAAFSLGLSLQRYTTRGYPHNLAARERVLEFS